MRGTGAIPPRAIDKFKQVFNLQQTRACSTSMPKKQHNFGEDKPVAKDKTEPIVAFSKPPPFPPGLGPVVALSLFEAWSNHDNSEE